MALAQPTNLQVQTLEPLVEFEQKVEPVVAAQTLVTFNQVIDDSASLAPREALITFSQMVDDSASIIPAQTLIVFEQAFTTYTEHPADTLIEFKQKVERVAPQRPLITFQQ